MGGWGGRRAARRAGGWRRPRFCWREDRGPTTCCCRRAEPAAALEMRKAAAFYSLRHRSRHGRGKGTVEARGAEGRQRGGVVGGWVAQVAGPRTTRAGGPARATSDNQVITAFPTERAATFHQFVRSASLLALLSQSLQGALVHSDEGSRRAGTL